MIEVHKAGLTDKPVSSRKILSACRRLHGFASCRNPRWIAGARWPSPAWLYEMKASNAIAPSQGGTPRPDWSVGPARQSSTSRHRCQSNHGRASRAIGAESDFPGGAVSNLTDRVLGELAERHPRPIARYFHYSPECDIPGGGLAVGHCVRRSSVLRAQYGSPTRALDPSGLVVGEVSGVSVPSARRRRRRRRRGRRWWRCG